MSPFPPHFVLSCNYAAIPGRPSFQNQNEKNRTTLILIILIISHPGSASRGDIMWQLHQNSGVATATFSTFATFRASATAEIAALCANARIAC
jgi:hypothetical protein